MVFVLSELLVVELDEADLDSVDALLLLELLADVTLAVETLDCDSVLLDEEKVELELDRLYSAVVDEEVLLLDSSMS